MSGSEQPARVVIRPAEERDLPAILAIFNQLVTDTTAVWIDLPVTLENRAALLAERRARGYPFLVAEIAGEVAGYATFGDFRAYDGYCRTVEHSIHLGQGFRGRGIGKTLMPPLITAARAAGKHVLVGAIAADNAASIRLHESFGFARVGLMPQVGTKFGGWLDLLLMQKMLDE